MASLLPLKLPSRKGAGLALAGCLALLVLAGVIASQVQTDFGAVECTNISFPNEQGITVRAKLLRPRGASPTDPRPGIVFIHGYQSTRETGDALSIELARRGFVVLAIDAIGRGNSGVPRYKLDDPRFDHTFGGRASLAFLKSLPFVRPADVGMVGHSLGAQMSYTVALDDPTVRALVIIGFAYSTTASPSRPKNMLMIIGQYDEFRRRMTGTRDIAAEWMSTPQTRAAIGEPNPSLGVTYGDFADGTARRVLVPPVIHIQETHNAAVVAQTLTWFKQALSPPQAEWRDPSQQIWPIKEWATLVALFAGFGALLPLGLLLMRTGLFSSLNNLTPPVHVCDRPAFLKLAGINGLLMWLYLPAALMIFAVHKYVVPIDGVLPMMVVNGIVWWFVLINLIGFFLFLRWFKRHTRTGGLSLADLGLSWRKEGLGLDGWQLGKTVLLAVILFGFAYGTAHLLEALLVVDYRFIFAFASDLTAHRFKLFLLYYPFLLVGFLVLGIFLHGQLRTPSRSSWLKTYGSMTAYNTLAMVVPLLIFLAIQYVPLLTTGAIPFVGPGGMLVLFVINLFHMIGVLLVVIPLSTWCFQLTGRPYLGALLCAAIVCWMFTSSQVIAPVPIN